MAIRRALRRGAGEEDTDESIGKAAIRIYKLLHTGEYEDAVGRRVPIRGDISKITKIIGLKSTEKGVLAKFHFMSSRIPGTRQVRNIIISPDLLRRPRVHDADAQRAPLGIGYTILPRPSL